VERKGKGIKKFLVLHASLPSLKEKTRRRHGGGKTRLAEGELTQGTCLRRYHKDIRKKRTATRADKEEDDYGQESRISYQKENTRTRLCSLKPRQRVIEKG